MPRRTRGSGRTLADTPAPAATTGPRDVVLIGYGPAADQAYGLVLQVLAARGALQVRAAVDASSPARAHVERRFSGAQSVASVDAVVAPPDTLAIVTSPARFHGAHCNAAFKRGWHVLSAMPFAPTARIGAQIIATAQQHERLLAVDQPHRFFPAARYFRVLCSDHLLGPPISFRIHEGMPRAVPSGPPAEDDKFESPDGVLHELGPRMLDVLTWWLGSAAVRRYADDAMGGVEANAYLELAFPEGVHGTVHLSREWPTAQTCTFVFERGIISWNTATANELVLQIGSAPSALRGALVTPLSARHSPPIAPLLASIDEARMLQLENILATIRGRDSLRTPAHEVMPALHLVDECYARRTSLPQPWLSPEEAVQARAFAPPVALRHP